IEILCTNMRPNTTYHAYYDGVLVDAFCKVYGKNLGDPLTSDPFGKMMIFFMVSVQYKQQFLSVDKTNNDNTVLAQKAFELRTANGNEVSVTYLPMFLRAG